MNTQNILNALRNISLVFSLIPEEFDVYYCVLDIYNKVWEYKNERNYRDEEIEFSYRFNLPDWLLLFDVLNEFGDLKINSDDEFRGSVVWISIKKKEN